LGFTEGKNMDRPGFLIEFIFIMSPELISRWPPLTETAIPRVIQGKRSYHGLTDQFNVSNGSISNVAFYSFGWFDTPIYKEKTPDRNPKIG
jgi:hypothetical protein